LPFRALLKELVSKVDGAQGVILLDWEGEVVQLWAMEDSERLTLRAAYIGVTFRQAQALTQAGGASRARQVVIEYEGARFVVEEIESGYIIVFELNVKGNLGDAMRQIASAVDALRREIA
jgi:predicted regulator of Ras-like GTPase activity (Roadblock/LC7/MglB family)